MDGNEEEEIEIPNKPKEKFACKFCARKFNSSRNCRLHVCSIHPDKFLKSAKLDHIPYHQFQIICFDFLSKHNWRKTNLIQFNYPYGCLYCEDNFRNSSFLKMHLINKHLDIVISKLKELQEEKNNKDVSIIEYNEQYQPEIKIEELNFPKQKDDPLNNCNVYTEDLVGKCKQVPKYDRVRTYKCSHCEINYLTVLSLTAHKRESHPETLDEPKFVYSCDMCGITFSSKCNLGRHKKGRCKANSKSDGVTILKTKRIRLENSTEEEVENAIIKIDSEKYNNELKDGLI